MQSSIRKLFFEELGWDTFREKLDDCPIDGAVFSFAPLAQKRGVVTFTCTASDGCIPSYPVRRKIDKYVAKFYHEHLIIFHDAAKTEQVWQWVRKEIGKPAACREHRYNIRQDGEALIQKLDRIAFGLDEESSLSLTDVTTRIRQALDVERVTKRFYDRFKTEHKKFLDFIEGIPDEGLQRWYASVMLNRLMFIYFIQKKGFLDGDRDYLRNKLAQMKQSGRDKYYKNFLCPLFFNGFALKKDDRPDNIKKLLGNIPYLNGGLFMRHQIEEYHGKQIQIPDAAFDKLFEFFKDYDWNLEVRPNLPDKEINPDVLGYIFEKYINQKQMGAYYTKEDITEYIGKNTVIPFLFDAARKKCGIAFEPDSYVWKLLQADPDRYIYESVKKGVERPLPKEIAVGIKDVSKRTNWNRPADSDYALPTEIWRETVARRQRYEEISAKITNGDIQDINDLITYNLDIRQFAQDVIENCEGPELLRAFWQAIKSVTVLDPTCGSGAFLFAALNILESLYEACLERMQVFIDELDASCEKHRPEKYSDFRKILDSASQHSNLKYFVFKSIIVNNLYGVDIMEEAIEICKLRLFLKLVAQVDSPDRIEPLPDIDFNILSGNTLVGFTNLDEVKKAVRRELDFDDTMERIEEKAQKVELARAQFRRQQDEIGGDVTAEDKQQLKELLKELDDELNTYLAGVYGVNIKNKNTYAKWLDSHKPFHWLAEFYEIMMNGGFDVIVGNPPYVEYKEVIGSYMIKGYKTESCGNLYAFVMERLLSLKSSMCRFGMIVPMSGHSTDRMNNLIEYFYNKASSLYIINISGDANPSVLFAGVKFRLAIFLWESKGNSAVFQTTRYLKWYSDERDYLFYKISYTPTSAFLSNRIPKISSNIHNNIVSKMILKKAGYALQLGKHVIYYHNAPVSWIRAQTFVPYFKSERDGVKVSTQLKPMYFDTDEKALAAAGVICSTTFFVWWITISDCYHLNKSEIDKFPFDFEDGKAIKNISLCTKRLMEDFKNKSRRREYVYETSGKVVYDEFYPKLSKGIIDDIDRILSDYFHFTSEELDFIINYDIKYRMGRAEE